MKLKIGQQFEVVEVLNRGWIYDNFIRGGWTIGIDDLDGIIRTLPNGYNYDGPLFWAMWLQTEVKPVGRLTVTKLK